MEKGAIHDSQDGQGRLHTEVYYEGETKFRCDQGSGQLHLVKCLLQRGLAVLRPHPGQSRSKEQQHLAPYLWFVRKLVPAVCGAWPWQEGTEQDTAGLTEKIREVDKTNLPTSSKANSQR